MGVSIRTVGEYNCDFCCAPVTGTWTSTTRTLKHGRQVVEYFHADTGPYETVLPSCSMIVAERLALTARGWTPPPGMAGWQAAGQLLSLRESGLV